ncbi:putative colanic acid biosynthesis acetyltransferase WcaF [Neorhizobium galegae]|uniref:putative colanic acid biosynthesis acetyltransferase n=1 Tax=Neorhizobium galegae TaxID=399 RepID=UPI001AE53B19|nr:putative colanic acid biosynthesis acetyltransferase WcaF [Neorhizobium galegae]
MTDFSSLRYVDTIPRSLKIKRGIWVLVWLMLFRPTPRGFCNGWRIFLLRLFGARIGRGSKVAASCFVWAPWNLEMGELSVLGDGVDCYTMEKIVIGSKVAVSQRSFLCTGSHDITSLRRPLITRPIMIGDHCWIAAESMVMPGVTIASGTVVGARSLVTKDLPAWSVCAGHPCVVIKPRRVASELAA